MTSTRTSLTRFSVPPLHKVTRQLAAVALGRARPDLVITGARVLSTLTERILPDREIWIRAGRIAAVKPAGAHRVAFGRGPGGASLPAGLAVYDAAGALLAPGLVDPHLHIESSMMTACAYAEPALINGTTTIFCDSHEIANVCDARGVEWMLADARRAPLSIFLTVPSTVPATNPRLETAGGDLTAAKIGRIFERWPEAVGLGEKMDFVQVATGDRRSHAILAQALRRGLPVSGHVYGREFVAACAASGVSDTHEAITREIADDFLEAGVWVFLRGGNPGTPWNSLPEAVKALTELGASPKRVCLCTDDRDADDLFLFGMDWVAREAVRCGIAPIAAWSMGSLHPATRFSMDGEIGSVAPARRADLVLLDDGLKPRCTWLGGRLVVEDRRPTAELERALKRRYVYPKAAYTTIRLGGRPSLIPAPPSGRVVANAIRPDLPGILLKHARVELDPAAAAGGGAPGARGAGRGRPAEPDAWAGLLEAHGLCFVTVVERHGRTGRVAHGLLKDFGLRNAAVGSSVGHDAHNIILAGTCERDMRLVLETIRRMRGGVCVALGGRIAAKIPLPIAGLLSDKRAPVVAAQTTALKRAWTEAGCRLPYMGFNLIPLSVIPEIRITDRGIVTVPGMEILPLFEAP